MVDRRRFLAGVAIPALSLSPLARAAATVWQPSRAARGRRGRGLPRQAPRQGAAASSAASGRPTSRRRSSTSATPITRNDAFFVRYHLAAIPQVDVKTLAPRRGWRCGRARARIRHGHAQARNSSRRAGGRVPVLGQPPRHVPAARARASSGAWAPWATPRWKGVRLRDVLNKVGVEHGAIEVALRRRRRAPRCRPRRISSRAFRSSARWTTNTLIAFEMNGKPLPHWNGYPGAPHRRPAGPAPTG